jgi:hypothetical protein
MGIYKNRGKKMKLQSHLWPVLIGVCIVAGINSFEHVFMPVVKDFIVQDIKQEDTKIILSGWMRKDRNCKFAGIVANGTDAKGKEVDVNLSFRDSINHNATRPIGTQPWGPWTIELPIHPNINRVSLTSIHHCHPAWTTTTKLIEIDLRETLVDPSKSDQDFQRP